jgi:hypothetical protein
MKSMFGDDPIDEYSKPTSVRETKLGKVFILRPRKRPDTPGRTVSARVGRAGSAGGRVR